jgi:hypothetical protein
MSTIVEVFTSHIFFQFGRVGSLEAVFLLSLGQDCVTIKIQMELQQCAHWVDALATA